MEIEKKRKIGQQENFKKKILRDACFFARPSTRARLRKIGEFS